MDVNPGNRRQTSEKRGTKGWQMAARLFTIGCMAASLILVISYILIPKTGMETLGIIVPWLGAFGVNVLLVIPTVICVFMSRRHLGNLWIYAYFLVFFGLHGAYFIHMQMPHLQRAYDNALHPESVELHRTLAALYMSAQQKKDLNPDFLARVKELIEEGVDVNRRMPENPWTTLRYACGIGDLELVRLISERGAPLHAPEKTVSTPLMEAVKGGHLSVASFLLEKGVDPNIENYAGKTPLFYAAKRGDAPMVKQLLTSGAKPRVRSDRSTPLTLAVSNGNVTVIRMLLEAGADPLDRNVRGQSLRAVAAQNKRFDIAALLNAYQPQSSEKPATGEKSPSRELYKALSEGNLELFQTLLEMGATADEMDTKGQTLLHRVCAKNSRPLTAVSNVRVAQLLIDHGANVNALSRGGRTSLMRTAASGSTDLAELLIRNDADVNASDTNGWTALMIAAGNGRSELTRLLISAGADPNARTNGPLNITFPLKSAVQSGHANVVRLIITAGAKIDPNGRDIGDLFQYGAKHPDIIKLLKETGMDLNTPDKMGRYPLTAVMTHGSTASAKILLDAGASPDIMAHGGKRPLLLAAQYGHAALLPLLFEKSKSLPDDRRLLEKALWTAVEYGQTEFTAALLKMGINGTITQADRVIARSRTLKKNPKKKAALRVLFLREPSIE